MGPAISIWGVPNILLGYTDCAVGDLTPCSVKGRGKGHKCEGRSTSLPAEADPWTWGRCRLRRGCHGGKPETHREVGCMSSEPLVLLLVLQPLPFCLQLILEDDPWVVRRLWGPWGYVRQQTGFITRLPWDHMYCDWTFLSLCPCVKMGLICLCFEGVVGIKQDLLFGKAIGKW